VEMVREPKGSHALSKKKVKPTAANYTGGTIKKLTVVLLAVALVLSTTPIHAQAPGTGLKSTFISPTPGLYVNGWPAFTVSYPKEWVELPPQTPVAVYQVMNPRPDLPPSPVLTIFVFPSPLSLDDWVKSIMPIWVTVFRDIKVLSDKPSQLKDGTPAREVEIQMAPKLFSPTGEISSGGEGHKISAVYLATKKDLTWVTIFIAGDREKPPEEWKQIAYSLTFLADRETHLNVPPDIRAFLDMYCADMVSGDLKAIMAHYSDRFIHSGMNRAFHEQWFRNGPISPIQTGITSCEVTVTGFEARGDKAGIDGFFVEKAEGTANPLKLPMRWQQIINEQGQWKWFGNQK
jgi:hypothetical protein